MRRRDFLRSDFTMFMALVFMLAGALLTILISNLAIVIVDPSTVIISGVIRSPGTREGTSSNQQTVGRIDSSGNVDKYPHFVDVQPANLILYPGDRRVSLRDLALSGNAFERLLESVKLKAATEYVVLLVRPGTAALTRRLREEILARGIDVGLDIYEDDQPVNIERAFRDRAKAGG